MTQATTRIVLIGAAVLAAVVVVAAIAGGGSTKKSEPAPAPAPAPGPPKPAPPPAPGKGPLEVPGVSMVDLRAKAPAAYIRQLRAPSDIRAVVLHQTGFTWKPSNPKWAEVRAHFVVRRDGSIVQNFDPEQQLRYGSNHANPFSITIEHEGNYPSASGGWWKGDTFGRDELVDAPALVTSARKLVAALRQRYPTITHVYAHRQWDAGKSNCPGPDIWRAIGEWSKDTLALKDGGPDWHWETGLPIPSTWKTPWLEQYA